MLRLIIILSAILVPSLSFAVEAQELLPPDSIVNILNVLEQIPYIGPALLVALKWIAIIAPVMTALSYVAQVILMIPELAARYAGAPALAEKIKFWADKINYWLKFLSVRNAKK